MSDDQELGKKWLGMVESWVLSQTLVKPAVSNSLVTPLLSTFTFVSDFDMYGYNTCRIAIWPWTESVTHFGFYMVLGIWNIIQQNA